MIKIIVGLFLVLSFNAIASDSETVFKEKMSAFSSLIENVEKANNTQEIEDAVTEVERVLLGETSFTPDEEILEIVDQIESLLSSDPVKAVTLYDENSDKLRASLKDSAAFIEANKKNKDDILVKEELEKAMKNMSRLVTLSLSVLRAADKAGLDANQKIVKNAKGDFNESASALYTQYTVGDYLLDSILVGYAAGATVGTIVVFPLLLFREGGLINSIGQIVVEATGFVGFIVGGTIGLVSCPFVYIISLF